MSDTIGIEFYNRRATKLLLWLEPFCIEVELQAGFEYRVESAETEYRLELDEEMVVLYLQKAYSPKVYRRPFVSALPTIASWELIEDYSFLDL